MLTVLLIFVIVIFVIRTRSQKNLHALPPEYPKGFPIVGHSLLFLTDSAKFWLTLQEIGKYSAEMGGVIILRLGAQIYYFITDTQDAWKAASVCIEKHYSVRFARPFVGDGLMISKEETWKRHRKLIQPAFSSQTIHGLLEFFNDQARKLVEQVDSRVGKGPFDHIEYLGNIMIETFLQGAFGTNIEDMDFLRKYRDSLAAGLELVSHRFQAVWLHSEFTYRLCDLKRKMDSMVVTFKVISNKILQNMINIQKRTTNYEEFSNERTTYQPLFSLLLELSSKKTLTNQEISDEIDTLIAGSYETTSNHLRYILMMLGAHPDVQDKLYTEFINVVGPHGDLGKKHLNCLPYTNAVIKETLRMIPLVPLFLRQVEKDVKLKNYTMRAGSQCMICPLVNRDNPIWGPDGDTFRPERWLDNTISIENNEFAGFGLGKRNCIGKQYAMVIMKVFLVHFVRKYRITADISNLKLMLHIVLKPVSETWISIEKRA